MGNGPSDPQKVRLDQQLVTLGLFDSRARAAAAVKAGLVRVNGERARKASQSVSAEDRIEGEAAHGYVSRGGLKLAHGLAHFGYAADGLTCLDVGASTGGFTDVLLQNRAAFVYALDVGHGQLHASLAGDARVCDLAGTNARHIAADLFDRPLDALVSDVSFISLELALDAALPLIRPHGWLIALIKPQFEVGRSGLGKNGVVSDPAQRQAACTKIENWLGAHASGWLVDGLVESPITGPQGNVEYLIGARRR